MRFSLQNNTSDSNINVLYNSAQASNPSLFSNRTTQYSYGFNGKENDNEVKGTGSQQDYGMRIYDPRLGKFLSVDPLQAEYPELTPYQFASNRPVDGIDRDGLEYEAVFGTAWSSSGYDPNSANQESVAQDFIDDFKETMKDPETYKGAIRGMTPFVLGGMGLIMTGGVGAGFIAEADATAVSASFDEAAIARAASRVEQSRPVLAVSNTVKVEQATAATEASSEGLASSYEFQHAVRQSLKDGKFDFGKAKSLVPEGTQNTFYPSKKIDVGEKYIFQNEGNYVELKWHSPHRSAPAGLNSASGNTAQIKVNDTYLNQNGSFTPNNKTNETHIPLKK